MVTDWMAEQMYDLGYVQHLDPAGIPNVEANIRDNLENVSCDPGRKYSVPWQSGMTGLIVDTPAGPECSFGQPTCSTRSTRARSRC